MISVLATQLQLPYDETAVMSLEELDRRCRQQQERSLLASVRAAEAFLGTREQSRHRDVEGLRDDH